MRVFCTLLFFTWFFNLFLPWWSVVIPGLFFGAWLTESGKSALLIGFSAAGLAWFIQALYIDISNHSILSGRIAEMMGTGSSFSILLLTFLTGGLLGAVSTLCGYFLKTSLKPASRSVHA